MGWLTSLMNRPHLLLVITALAWGGNAIAGKFALGHISPMMLTLVRWSIAMVVIWAIAVPEVRRDWPVIRTRLPYLFIMGAAGFTAFNVLMYSALQFTSSINVVIMQSAMPLVIFAGNLLVFRVAASSRQFAGFLITLVGVVLVVSNGHPAMLLHGGLNIGDGLMVIAVMLYAAYSIALRAKPDIHWKSFFAFLVTAAFVTSVPAAIYEAMRGNTIAPVTLQGVLVGLYAALFPSIVSQLFFIRAVEQLGANIAGLYINLVPVFGTLLAVLLLGEAFSWHQALALLMVIGGILFAQNSLAAAWRSIRTVKGRSADRS